METDLQDQIDEAANIAKSERWDWLNERIQQLAKNPEKYEAWRLVILAGLSTEMASEYKILLAEHENSEARISTICWHARNLLELSVWAAYCSMSTENARAFYEDVGNDGLDLFNAFEKWGTITNQDKDWLATIPVAKEKLANNGKQQQIESLDGSYTRVRKAAEIIGIVSLFDIANKILSKYAHPTALSIAGSYFSEEDQNQLRHAFCSLGCTFFLSCFSCLESHVLSIE